MKSSNSRLKTITIILAILTIATYSNYAISQGVVTLPTAKKQTTTKQQSSKPDKNTTVQKIKANDTNYGRLAEQAYDSDNYADAIKYGELGAKQNNTRAITVLGDCYLYDRGEFGGAWKDYKKAMEYFQAAAGQNYVYAQYQLARCYQYGWGVTKNYSTARLWYAKVIENLDANKKWIEKAKERYKECNYGTSYNTSGNYGELAYQACKSGNDSEALEYGKLGAVQKDIQAMVYLGDCFMYGYGVSQDYEEAVSYFQTAAEQNYGYAQYQLAQCYQNGWGVTKNHTTALHWYSKAIENPNSTAYCVEEAKENYQKCNNDTSYSYNNYGELAAKAYSLNIHTDVIKYGELGADLYDAKAMTTLGLYYAYSCTPKKYDIAVAYFQKAAEQNYGEAQFELARCYQYGQGVTKDYTIACQWYTEVIENPDAPSVYVVNAKADYQKCNNGIPYSINRN